jgi:hypothetical protein
VVTFNGQPGRGGLGPTLSGTVSTQLPILLTQQPKSRRESQRASETEAQAFVPPC